LKAVVIGGAGHIGNAIVRALLARGYEVTACGRRPALPPNLAGLPVKYSSGDAEGRGQLAEWIAGHDLVVDAAAPYPFEALSVINASRGAALARAEVRTRRLIDALRPSGATLLYVGSFVTLAAPRGLAQRAQDAVMRLIQPYFEVKELIEAMILQRVRRGLRAVIINPTYCIGPWDIRDPAISTVPLLLRGKIAGTIPQMLNLVDVRDVAAAALAAFDHEWFGRPILIRSHDVATSEFYAMVCELGGVPAPRLIVPTRSLMGFAYLGEVMYQLAGKSTLLPSGGMMLAAAFDYCPRDNCLAELGVSPTPLPETLRDAIAWYRQIGHG
jgi:dihydroflavonol-4-reductase